MEKTQREYYLNEQLKAIQKELGDSDDGADDNEYYLKKDEKNDNEKFTYQIKSCNWRKFNFTASLWS